MRKHISFAITATILGLAMIFWVKVSMVENNANVARPRADLSSPISKPYRSVRVLDLIY
jgi:hypothetical protein